MGLRSDDTNHSHFVSGYLCRDACRHRVAVDRMAVENGAGKYRAWAREAPLWAYTNAAIASATRSIFLLLSAATQMRPLSTA